MSKDKKDLDIVGELGLKGTASPDYCKLQQALSKQIEMLPLIIEHHAMQGKVKKAEYDGLIKAGFTESQALTIVSSKP